MRRVAVILVLVAGLGAGGAGCATDCSPDCGIPVDELTFVGELLELDDDVATFATPDDGIVRITVLERSGFLDIGSRYDVEAVIGRGSVVWESTINAACACAGQIRHADGETIDTSVWTGLNRTFPATELLWLAFAVPVLTLLGVTAMRLRRGADHDPYADLPDDGSWLEYDGYVDADDDTV
ncbi:MAG: hypothetical protein AAF548_17555 [Actinomycetota bacterium]